MASTGKNRKQRSKVQTMSLQSFLAKDSENIQAGYSIVTAKRSTIDWAAEAEREGPEEDDHPDVSYSGRDHQQYILPSAPMGPNIDMGKVPTSPPFTAFVGGLSYDVEQEDIRDFFKNLKVTSIRIPRSTAGETERFRGFGYVEFEDRQSLIDALAMNESFFKSGRVKIDIAENQNDPNRRRDKSDRSDRNDRDRSERMVGNWRSAPRDETASARPERSYRDDQDPPRERERFGGDRDRDRYGSRGFERGPNSDRESSGGGFRDRGYGNFSRGGSDRSFTGDRDRQRDNGSDRGYDRGSRGGGRRDFGGGFERRNDDRQDYGSSRSTWGSNYERPERSDHPSDNAENEGDVEREAPRERPKLVIKPRTKPIEEAGAPVAASAIFGGAKPVDTAAKEREIEQRLAKERELAASRPLGDNRVRETERSTHKDEIREDSKDSQDEGNQRRSSTGSQVCSPRTSTSVPPPSSVRSYDGGASGQSETDEEKEKPPPVSAKPLSPRREDTKAVPAPPPKENAWAKRSTVQQRPPSSGSGERSKSSDMESDSRHSNTAPYTANRSSSVSSTGSDDKPHSSSADSRPPASRKDDAGNGGRRSDDNVFRSRGEQRERDDRGTSRGMTRGAPRGTGRGYGDRRSGQDNYSKGNSNSSYSGRNNDRQRDNEQPKEMPKSVEPESPSYTSSNKYTQLMAEEHDD